MNDFTYSITKYINNNCTLYQIIELIRVGFKLIVSKYRKYNNKCEKVTIVKKKTKNKYERNKKENKDEGETTQQRVLIR